MAHEAHELALGLVGRPLLRHHHRPGSCLHTCTMSQEMRELGDWLAVYGLVYVSLGKEEDSSVRGADLCSRATRGASHGDSPGFASGSRQPGSATLLPLQVPCLGGADCQQLNHRGSAGLPGCWCVGGLVAHFLACDGHGTAPAAAALVLSAPASCGVLQLGDVVQARLPALLSKVLQATDAGSAGGRGKGTTQHLRLFPSLQIGPS